MVTFSPLSILNKLSSGYWNLFDPTNGFTAIHARVAAALPLEQVSRGYFFESDMLFHLNIVRAVVRERVILAEDLEGARDVDGQRL
jgi:hypothetical protein